MLLTSFPNGLVSDYRHNMVRSLELNVKKYIYIYERLFYLLYGKPKRVANARTASTQGILLSFFFPVEVDVVEKKEKERKHVCAATSARNIVSSAREVSSQEIFVKPSK